MQYSIIDLNGLPNGLAKLREIHQSAPGIPLLIAKADDDPRAAVEAVLAGARGCIDLNSTSITVRHALKKVSRGVLSVMREEREMVVDRLSQQSRRRDPQVNQTGSGRMCSLSPRQAAEK